jgi:two-component system CheB/CheR fusion protein
MVEVIDTVSVKELEVRDKEGRWHILRLRPYRTLDNKIDGVVVVLIDVDTLKRDQEIRRRQSELLEQTEEPIFMWELGGGITYWNRGAEETYGFTRSQAMGRTSYELLATSPAAPGYLDALQREGHWKGELTHARRDGQPVVVESRMVMERHRDRSPLVFQTDHVITERKRMEGTLRQRAEELLAADQSKDLFLAMLAHELRNPLAPLSNAVEIMRQPGASPAMLDRAREAMSHQIQNLSRLVDDLLDVSRMTQGRIELRKEPVDLLTIIERTVETSRHHLDERGQALNLSLPTEGIYLEADVFRLEQILGNLLNNASKFTARGGQIWLTVEGPPASPGHVVIRVRDVGIGIAPEQLSRVFDLFMQVDSSLSRTSGGLGIGLTLVRHLVELHGGSLEAHSPGLGKGSEFVVRLPASPERFPEAVRAMPRERSDGKPVSRRVLVTDDNVDGAETLAIVLRQAGHDVRVAHSGPTTLEIAQSFQPYVVLLDVGMPGMDGYETARRLRGMAGLENALLVALTGFGQESDRRRAREAGFDEFLVKPALPEVVTALAGQIRSGDTFPGASIADSRRRGWPGRPRMPAEVSTVSRHRPHLSIALSSLPCTPWPRKNPFASPETYVGYATDIGRAAV